MRRLERAEEVFKELQLFPITTNILLQYSAKADIDYILAERDKTIDLFVYFKLYDESDTADSDEYHFVNDLREKLNKASLDGLIGEFDSVDNPFGNILAFRRFKR